MRLTLEISVKQSLASAIYLCAARHARLLVSYFYSSKKNGGGVYADLLPRVRS